MPVIGQPQTTQREETILNVDDDAAKRYTVSRILRHAGYEVVEAGNGRDALKAAENGPSLVILDVRLPDMSGYEVCQILKADRDTKSIPVLHLSASFIEIEHRAYGLDMGADGYLTHPVDPQILLATVRSLIRMHQAEVTARASAARLDEAYREQKRIAEMLQRSLLIKVNEDTYPGIHLATFYEAAWDEASVGGDFYDTFMMPDKRIALAVGDATGKGLAAATRTAEVKFALRAFLHEHGDAGVALLRLNEFLCDMAITSVEGDSIVALSIGLVDIEHDGVQFAAAGAEPPLILSADRTSRTAGTTGVPVGAIREATYEATTMDFGPGDTILMATDGITEARNGREFLSYEGMVSLAAQHLQVGKSVEQEGQALLDAAREFALGKFQDDVCILLARRT